MATPLPKTHLALVQEVKAEPLIVKEIPTPQATPGSAIIKVLSAPVMAYLREVYDGTRPYQYPVPLVTGTSAIGRIVATGSDAVKLKHGDLVFYDCTIHGRDDSDAIILAGLAEGGTEGSRKLIRGEWRDSTFAEYAKVPLENCYVLDEQRLCSPIAQGGRGYTIDQLGWLLQALIPYGGLRSIGLQPGETILISPATGGFGSAAVVVALAMGARVIAMARNVQELEKIKRLNPARVEIVPMTGNLEEEVAALKKTGTIDAFLDISPIKAKDSTHFKAGILSLRRRGRVSLMGGLRDDFAIPHHFVMRFNLTLKGQWMYERDDIFAFLGLLNTGVLDVKDLVKITGVFGLEDWKKAFDLAFESGRLGEITVLRP